MPVTLTIKNVPAALVKRLRAGGRGRRCWPRSGAWGFRRPANPWG